MLKKWYFKGIYVVLGVSCLNKLDTATKVTKWFSNSQALSSVLAALGMLQPQAFRLLNHLVPLVLGLNYYAYSKMDNGYANVISTLTLV